MTDENRNSETDGETTKRYTLGLSIITTLYVLSIITILVMGSTVYEVP